MKYSLVFYETFLEPNDDVKRIVIGSFDNICDAYHEARKFINYMNHFRQVAEHEYALFHRNHWVELSSFKKLRLEEGNG